MKKLSTEHLVFMMAPKRKKLRSAAALVLLITVLAVWWFWPRRADPAARAAAGYYLADGGRALIVIEFDPHRGLYVPDEYLKFTPLHADPQFLNQSVALSGTTIRPGTSVQYVDGNLLFIQQLNYDNAGAMFGAGSVVLTYSVMLTPSPARPGDWDLTDGQWNLMSSPISAGWGGGLLIGFLEAVQSIAILIKGEADTPLGGGVNQVIHPEIKNIPSYFQKIDNPRIADLFREFEKSEHEVYELELARELLAAQPDQPILNLYELELAAHVEDPARAAQRWREWREKFYAWDKHPVWTASYQTLNAINHRRATLAGYDFAATPGMMSVEEQTAWLVSLLDYDYTITRHDRLIEFSDLISRAALPVPDFLSLQTLVKTTRVRATFDLLQGRPEAALLKFAGAYRLGQNLNADIPLISKLIGILIRALAIGGLEVYALNADLTREELAEFQALLERLDQLPGQEDGGARAAAGVGRVSRRRRSGAARPAGWHADRCFFQRAAAPAGPVYFSPAY